jgi:4-alpha-glucanotransferase
MKKQMVPARALHRLADRLGLSRSYVSAAGETRVVSDPTLRALCGAAGQPAASDAQAEQALARLDGDGDRLDPVLVVEVGCALDTAWRGAGHDADAFDWRIVHEQGAVGRGRGRLTQSSAAGAMLRVPLDDIAPGYHRLEVACSGDMAAATLIVVPSRAYTPPAWQTEQRRDWSITAQLYSLRSQRNWGIGDFSDLGSLARHAVALGASSIGLSPLHALFAANPRHLSPYSPSSRVFLNALYIDVEAVPEYAGSDAANAITASAEFRQRLEAVRASEFVDHEAVWSLKLQVLRVLHAEFRAQQHRRPQGERALAFQAFKDAGGVALVNFARFEALQQHLVAQGVGASWHAWPQAYRHVDSAEIAAFAAEHDEAIDFSAYLQWEADRQLGAQAQAMREAGMATGLYRDLAVGVDPNGAEAWGEQDLLVAGATVGAPPDVYNPKGQDWGLTPFNPKALQQTGYAAFIATMRANMRHAGALRIDHVLGLKRLYWVPSGMGAAAGAYVDYPFEHLLGIVALESHRNQCLVVGEDLGTVPEGFREEAQRRGLLSYRVLMFERENGDGAFLSPSDYPELAAAAASTHDLPTLAGLWRGRDLEWRRDLALYPTADEAAMELAFRAGTRAALIDALGLRDRLDATAPTQAGPMADSASAAIRDLIEAAYRYLADAPSRLLLVQIEDLAAEIEQMNMPGTVDEHPNWRRRLKPSLDALFGDPAVVHLAREIQRARSRSNVDPLRAT